MGEKRYDVVILGGGIIGTALYFTLTNYTDIKRIALVERHKDLAQVASHTTQNSQTLHFGDIETNYTFEKASKVAPGANLVKNYLERFAKKDKAHQKQHKMVIAVGASESKELRARFKKFKPIFPSIKLLERDQIAKFEPKVIEGRDPDEEIVALFSEDGYIMDYYRLAKSFVKNSRKGDIYLGASVKQIEKTSDGWRVETKKGTLLAKFLVVDAGAISLYFAKKLGYAKDLSVLSVAGNFYKGPAALKGKVYTMQNPKLPFAAIHGDPDVHSKGYTRYGPTAKPLFMLERRNYKTVKLYFESFSFTPRGIYSALRVILDWTPLSYMAKNTLYEIPLIGTWLFTKNVRKIIPTAKASQIHKDRGYGGTRPQIIDLKTHKLALGEARIEDKDIIFNITPSPGASTCLAIAKNDARQVASWLSKSFDEERFENDLS